MRHTKIVATVGPASDSDAVLDALIAAGTNIFRLNFSHGTHESHRATFWRIRHAAARAQREVAILQDLGGPKIRTGRLQGGTPIACDLGAPLTIATGDFVGGPGRVSTSFAGLARSVRPGDRLLLADGIIELRVDATDGAEIRTTVVEAGRLGEHKGINAPGVPLPTSAITSKDADDLQFGLALGVDMVALSFVQSGADIRQARRLIADARPDGADIPVVAKLERPQAIDHLQEILELSDAVMVARGDLGLEMPLERVPRVQKEITRDARRHGVPVIVATQVLESMTVEGRPTRAEVNDAANAVDDGVDAIMLSGETAIGVNPARVVQTLDAIIRETETGPPIDLWSVTPDAVPKSHVQALCEAAVTLANRGEAQAIVAITRAGRTARWLSVLRPRAPIIATTDSAEVARRLSIYRGVVPLVVPIADNIEAARTAVHDALGASGIVAPGATVVLINLYSDLSRDDANYLRIQRL
jgi:pyruvate kinase